MTEKFDEKYEEREVALEQKFEAAFHRIEQVKAGIRADVGLSDEERMERFMAAHESMQQELNDAASTFVAQTFNEIGELERTINEGTGEKFSEHLTSLVNVPDDKLQGLMSTAQRTGQKDLARAIAQTALDRNLFAVFDAWADSEPEVAEALKRRRSFPEDDRIIARAQARCRVPKADRKSLQPTEEDRKRAASKEAAKKMKFRQFFGPQPLRKVGRRVA